MARLLSAFGALVAAPVAAELALERELSGYTFGHYLEEFGKSYHPGELERRQGIFEANLDLIRTQNRDPRKTWFAAPNGFTDWTNEEFRSRRTGGTRAAPGAGLQAPPPSEEYSGDLPDAIDWRQKAGVVTKVKDQGGCGSCWAFSAVESLESHLAITMGKPAPVLSPQQIVSCSPNPQHCGGSGGCSGSTQWLAFNYTETAGIGLESTYPYVGVTGTCDMAEVKPVAANSGYIRLPSNNYTALAHAVATLGPVSISLAAGSVGWQIYGGGVLDGDCGFDVDHGVQLVGYGTDGGKGYWIVRNSWGPAWGEQGYIRIARKGEGEEPCGVDSTPQEGSACAGDIQPKTYCGVCAILSDSSYPTGVKSLGDVEADMVI